MRKGKQNGINKMFSTNFSSEGIFHFIARRWRYSKWQWPRAFSNLMGMERPKLEFGQVEPPRLEQPGSQREDNHWEMGMTFCKDFTSMNVRNPKSLRMREERGIVAVKTITNMWNCSVLCGRLDGRGVYGRMGICICMAESFCCSSETITTLVISYTPIQSKNLKKKKPHSYFKMFKRSIEVWAVSWSST